MPRVPQFSPPVKCSLGGNPVAPSSQRPRKPYPTPPPSIMPQLLTASMELISQMRFLSWSMICFSCWFFCLSFCKERKRGQSATTSMTSAKLSERRYSRQGRNYSLYLVDKQFKPPPPTLGTSSPLYDEKQNKPHTSVGFLQIICSISFAEFLI